MGVHNISEESELDAILENHKNNTGVAVLDAYVLQFQPLCTFANNS